MKKTNLMLIATTLLAAGGHVNAQPQQTHNHVNLQEKHRTLPIYSMVEYIQDKNGYIPEFKDIDVISNKSASNVFSQEAHNLKAKSIIGVMDFINMTSPLNAKPTSIQIKSYPKGSALKSSYIVKETLSNGDNFVYTVVDDKDFKNKSSHKNNLKKNFLEQAVIGSFEKVKSNPTISSSINNYLNGYEVLNLRYNSNEYEAIFKENKEHDKIIYSALVKKK